MTVQFSEPEARQSLMMTLENSGPMSRPRVASRPRTLATLAMSRLPSAESPSSIRGTLWKRKNDPGLVSVIFSR